MTKKTTPELQDMSAEIDALVADSRYAKKVAVGLERLAEIDRQYAMSLAAIRAAFSLTQTDVAERLGVTQSSIAKLEARDDFLLSTLRSYLLSIGGEVEIKVRFGQQPPISLALSSLVDHGATASPPQRPDEAKRKKPTAKKAPVKKAPAKRRVAAA